MGARPGFQADAGELAIFPPRLLMLDQQDFSTSVPKHGVQQRWRTISNRQMPVATETFRLETEPRIGMCTR